MDWNGGPFRGSTPQVGNLLAAAESLAGAPVDVVALDMPVAKERFTSRRAADDAISRAFGGRGCSAHSPNDARPGRLGRELMEQLAAGGYPLATSVQQPGTLRHTIEVYPHPALLSLLGREYRVPYKVSKSRRYWPDLDRSQRTARLLGEFRAIHETLETALGCTGLELPSQVHSLAALKRHEDVLDALVCAWVGRQYVEGNAVAYGDDSSTIWVPPERKARGQSC